MSILVDLVDLVDLWPVNPKTGFERPCQSTLGSPIDFNGNRQHRSVANTDYSLTLSI